MAQFQHFIITRFNLKQQIWQHDKQGQSVNDATWLQSRYDLFERYCLPSLQHQTEQRFSWLVFFDIDTPEYFKAKNQALSAVFNNFKPIYVIDFKNFEASLDANIRRYLDADTPYLITTRLDNDDCFHKNAVATIQCNFEAQDRSIIDLSHGLTLQVKPVYKLALKKHTQSGPFISLIEKVHKDQTLITVYDREHLQWQDDAHFITDSKGFYWLQIIHDRNITNSLSSEFTLNKSYLDGFDCIDNFNFGIKYRVFVHLHKTRLYKLYKTIKNS